MSLPVNIEEILGGNAVEWERLEFKKGWNPESIMHTICGFANDINGVGGGYLVVGVEEADGVPKRPIRGLEITALDKIQRELVEISHKIQPNYFPVFQPTMIDGRHCILIWAPAGEMRPYTAPCGKEKREHYIRQGSSTIMAKGANLRRLQDLAVKIPYDDQTHTTAHVQDLKLDLIQAFLQDIQSELFENCTQIPFEDLCRQLQIARGPKEYLRPVNVGLMFFSHQPHTFFPRAWIDLVIHDSTPAGGFVSMRFEGPVQKQMKDCMEYLKLHVITTKTFKIRGKSEALTLENWPYNAIKEALANAVFHKGYDSGQPIEIQVFHDRMEILNYPGSLPPISNAELNSGKVSARNYRNRRIGDLLRDLKLTEGKATGIPLIHRQMKLNGNPPPVFFTDDHRTLFQVTLPCHPHFIKAAITWTNVSDTVKHKLNPDQKQIVKLLTRMPGLNASEIAGRVNKSKPTVERVLRSLKTIDVLEFKGSPKNGGYYLIPSIQSDL